MTDNPTQLAKLWVMLEEIKAQLDNTAIPLGAHLGLDHPEMKIAMDELSTKIGTHFTRFKLVSERRRTSSDIKPE